MLLLDSQCTKLTQAELNELEIVLILIKNQFIHGLGEQMPEDKEGCGLRGVDLFPNNVLIILRLLKVDCDMGQTRRNVTWVKSKQKYHLLKLNSIEGHKPFSFLSFNQRSSERPTLSTR